MRTTAESTSGTGRNAVLLAQLGFDVIAIDFSKAMVEETRRRVADILGPTEAGTRLTTHLAHDEFPWHYERNLSRSFQAAWRVDATPAVSGSTSRAD